MTLPVTATAKVHQENRDPTTQSLRGAEGGPEAVAEVLVLPLTGCGALSSALCPQFPHLSDEMGRGREPVGMGVQPVLGDLHSSLAQDLHVSKAGLFRWSLCVQCSGLPRLAANCCTFSDHGVGQHFTDVPRRTLGDGI